MSNNSQHVTGQGGFAGHSAEELNRIIIAAMPCGMVQVAVDGSIVTANAEALRVLGLSFDEIANKYTSDFVTETIFEDGSHCPVSAYPVTKALVTGEVQAPVIIGVRRPDATVSWAEYRATPLKDQAGKVNGAIVTFLDVTEFRERLVRAETSENQLRSFLENFPHYLVSFARDGTIIYVNRAHGSTTREQVLSSKIYDFLPENEHAAMEERFRQIFDEQKSFNYETQSEINGQQVFFSNTFWPEVKDGSVVAVNNFATDITETKRLYKLLEYRATHDFLTGLANRYLFEDETVLELAKIRDTKRTSVLGYLDLDQFKVVNDTCGHIAGDELLKQIGFLLKQQISPNMLLARLGGDEFGILFRDMALAEAIAIAEATCDAVFKYVFTWERNRFKVSVSIGLAVLDLNSKNYSQVLKDADVACYAAKEHGRNAVRVFRTDDVTLQERTSEMESVRIINDAIDSDKLTLFYQEIVPNAHEESRKSRSFEILLRLPDARGQLNTPAALIAAAERYDLMPGLDFKILTSTFGWLRSVPRLIDSLDFITINLSAKSLGHVPFQKKVLELLADPPLPVEKLRFEITETAVMSNFYQARIFMQSIIDRGCAFILDDFGTGISSFAYLKDLPVTMVKIDGVFVRNLVSDAIDYSMVKTMHDLATIMGKKTIAEFVETAEILEKITTIGIDYSQGYHLHRPEAVTQLA
jgi:diguanylate cyclase (GGDEF)-like protein/PAS domain S-box-containing protein